MNKLNKGKVSKIVINKGRGRTLRWERKRQVTGRLQEGETNKGSEVERSLKGKQG